LIRVNDPTVLAVVDTRISGVPADQTSSSNGLAGRTHVAKDYRGGIWLFPTTSTLNPTIKHAQHITGANDNGSGA